MERFKKLRLLAHYKGNREVECGVCARSRDSFEFHHDIAVAAFRGVLTRNTFPGLQDTTDDPLLVAASSSTTTGGEVSFAYDPRAFCNKETGMWCLEGDGNELEYGQAKGA